MRLASLAPMPETARKQRGILLIQRLDNAPDRMGGQHAHGHAWPDPVDGQQMLENLQFVDCLETAEHRATAANMHISVQRHVGARFNDRATGHGDLQPQTGALDEHDQGGLAAAQDFAAQFRDHRAPTARSSARASREWT